MFHVGDDVRLVDFGYLTGTVGKVAIVEPVNGLINGYCYWVDVPGYSETPKAREINAMENLDHGYVPLFEPDLELM